MVEHDEGTITQARLVVGAATDRPTVLSDAGRLLDGTPLGAAEGADPPALSDAAATGSGEVELRADSRGSAAYKRELLAVYLRRAVREALAASSAVTRA